MLPDGWATYFGIIVGAATGLAGLLFVAFSIYVANRRIDPLAQSIGTLYFGELVTSLVIGLASVLPPHLWWVGALLGAVVQILWWVRAQVVVIRYRKIARSAHAKDTSATKDERAAIYEANRLRVSTLFVPLCESLLVFGGGLAGALTYFGMPPVILPAWLPLQVVGFFAGWYLISATVNAWFFLFHLSHV